MPLPVPDGRRRRLDVPAEAADVEADIGLGAGDEAVGTAPELARGARGQPVTAERLGPSRIGAAHPHDHRRVVDGESVVEQVRRVVARAVVGRRALEAGLAHEVGEPARSGERAAGDRAGELVARGVGRQLFVVLLVEMPLEDQPRLRLGRDLRRRRAVHRRLRAGRLGRGRGGRFGRHRRRLDRHGR